MQGTAALPSHTPARASRPLDRRQALREHLLASDLGVVPPLISIVLQYCLSDSLEQWLSIVGQPVFDEEPRFRTALVFLSLLVVCISYLFGVFASFRDETEMRVHYSYHRMIPISYTYLMQRLQWEWSFDEYLRQFTAQELAQDTERMRALIDVAPPGGVVFAIESDRQLWQPPTPATAAAELPTPPSASESSASLKPRPMFPAVDVTGERSDLTVVPMLAPPMPDALRERSLEQWGLCRLYAVPSALWHGRIAPSPLRWARDLAVAPRHLCIEFTDEQMRLLWD
jgi:hypothetical protein